LTGSREILFLITQQPPSRGKRAFGLGTLVSMELAGIVASAFSQDSWLEGGFNSRITVEFGGTDLLQTLALEAGCDKMQTQRTFMRHWLSKFGNKYKFDLVPRLKYGFLTLDDIPETPLDKSGAELAGARFLVHGSAPELALPSALTIACKDLGFCTVPVPGPANLGSYVRPNQPSQASRVAPSNTKEMDLKRKREDPPQSSTGNAPPSAGGPDLARMLQTMVAQALAEAQQPRQAARRDERDHRDERDYSSRGGHHQGGSQNYRRSGRYGLALYCLLSFIWILPCSSLSGTSSCIPDRALAFHARSPCMIFSHMVCARASPGFLDDPSLTKLALQVKGPLPSQLLLCSPLKMVNAKVLPLCVIYQGRLRAAQSRNPPSFEYPASPFAAFREEGCQKTFAMTQQWSFRQLLNFSVQGFFSAFSFLSVPLLNWPALRALLIQVLGGVVAALWGKTSGHYVTLGHRKLFRRGRSPPIHSDGLHTL
jgi:hypothetical protein